MVRINDILVFFVNSDGALSIKTDEVKGKKKYTNLKYCFRLVRVSLFTTKYLMISFY